MAQIQAPSPPPTRLSAGATTDSPFGPLAMSGFGNPFFYHQFADDFDNQLGATGLYTLSGTGSAAHTAGDGGLALLSTTGTAGTFASIQLPAASFLLPSTGATPPGSSTQVKKVFYLTRFRLSDITLSAFVAGLSAIDTTPFTAVLDGIWFSKAASSTQINLNIAASSGNSPTGSAVSAVVAIPTSVYTLVNATDIDLGFFVDIHQNIYAYAGNPIVGYIPQSARPAGAGAGAVASLQQSATATPFSTALMSPILAVSNGATAAVKTMSADFHLVQKER